MKELRIKSLTLHNFKKAKDVHIDFNSDGSTTISGDNGTGKTTIEDAFDWLLFGKNSQGLKDFNVKTLDDQNQVIHKLEHEVIGTINAGRDIVLKRILREKWVTKRGSATQEMSGNETLFFVDEVPVQAGEYQKFIDTLIPEGLFKMITSPSYFTSQKWDIQRRALIDIAGRVDDLDVAGDDKKSLKLLDFLRGKSITMEQYKKEVAEKRKRLKDEIDLIPSRIDEVTRMIPETTPDFVAIKENIALVEKEASVISKRIEDRTTVTQAILDQVSKRQKKIHEIESEMENLKYKAESDAKQGARTFRDNLASMEATLESEQANAERTERKITQIKQEVAGTEESIAVLRKEWERINNDVFVESLGNNICPVTKEAYACPHGNVVKEGAKQNFHEAKVKSLDVIDETGLRLKQTIENLNGQIDTLTDELFAIKRLIQDKELDIYEFKKTAPLEASVTYPKEYYILESEAKTLKEEPNPTPGDNATDELKQQRTELQERIYELKKQLEVENTIKGHNDRLGELRESERKLAQQIADYEGIEFAMLEFNKKKISMITEKVNKKFSLVKFKMFNILINGGEEETCECMVNGVPHADLNTASKINAGVDIINTLVDHYDISAPVFIDNAESISNILPTRSQLIRLEKVTGQQKLTVN